MKDLSELALQSFYILPINQTSTIQYHPIMYHFPAYFIFQYNLNDYLHATNMIIRLRSPPEKHRSPKTSSNHPQQCERTNCRVQKAGWVAAGLPLTLPIQNQLTLDIINQQMLVLLLLMSLGLCQVAVKVPNALKDLPRNASSLDSLEAKAFKHLIAEYPQLANYTSATVSSEVSRSNQDYASNLKDFLFELTLGNTKLRALVTLSNLTKQSYVALSPIVSYTSPSPRVKKSFFAQYSMFLGASNKSSVAGGSIINQVISSDNISSISADNASQRAALNGSQPAALNASQRAHLNASQRAALNGSKRAHLNGFQRAALNGFIAYQNLKDPLVEYALDYLASVHPNMLNYQLQNSFYQIVAGINIKLIYLGYDNYSNISAVVNFDLKLKPKLIAFELGCVAYDEYCNPLAAWSVYQSIESILVFHPQLFQYRIENLLVVNKITPGTKIKVLLSFYNAAKSVRTMVEQEIQPDKVTVLSFYTYSQDQ